MKKSIFKGLPNNWSYRLHRDCLLRRETKARDARMAWWRDAKYGMFIHWGL